MSETISGIAIVKRSTISLCVSAFSLSLYGRYIIERESPYTANENPPGADVADFALSPPPAALSTPAVALWQDAPIAAIATQPRSTRRMFRMAQMLGSRCVPSSSNPEHGEDCDVALRTPQSDAAGRCVAQA